MIRDRLELQKIAQKLLALKREGYGKLEIKVQEGRVTYMTLSIGEQISFEDKLDGSKSG